MPIAWVVSKEWAVEGLGTMKEQLDGMGWGGGGTLIWRASFQRNPELSTEELMLLNCGAREDS